MNQESSTVSARDFELYRRDVEDYELVQMRGGGAYIRVRDVGRHAIVRALGAGATIEVLGRVSARALLIVEGANAKILYHDADPSAEFRADGYKAAVVQEKNESHEKHRRREQMNGSYNFVRIPGVGSLDLNKFRVFCTKCGHQVAGEGDFCEHMLSEDVEEQGSSE